jgi:hypothetical protein
MFWLVISVLYLALMIFMAFFSAPIAVAVIVGLGAAVVRIASENKHGRR